MPKQTRCSSEEVAASRKAKDAKKKKEEMKQASINCVAEFEQKQAEGTKWNRLPGIRKTLKSELCKLSHQNAKYWLYSTNFAKS